MTKTFTISPELKILSHPWYRKWECGHLKPESLRHYAQEYYWQVAQFPRYLSLLHSQLENLDDRRVVLENLNDEENAEAPHPKLWLDFAESLGASRTDIENGKPGPAAARLVDEFRQLVGSGRAQALGAILAYESQVPEVASFKGKALREHYLTDDRAAQGTRFFDVHAKADVWHTEELLGLFDKLSPAEKEQAQAAGTQASKALWNFLDAMPN